MKTSPGYKKEAAEEKSESKSDKDNESVTIRKIHNGYIAKHSWNEKDEDGMGRYKEKEVYHEKNPLE